MITGIWQVSALPKSHTFLETVFKIIIKIRFIKWLAPNLFLKFKIFIHFQESWEDEDEEEKKEEKSGKNSMKILVNLTPVWFWSQLSP